MNSVVQRYERTVRRAVRWAGRHHARLMDEGDIQAHYKAPYFWTATGHMRMAGLYRALIEKRFLRKDGDFRTEETVKGFGHFTCTVHNQYIYPNGWLIVGLQKAGAYDLARKALAFVLRFQDRRHGGFYCAFDPVSKKIVRRLMDSSSTSSAGLACLACGRTAEAARAGDFLLRLLALQPEADTFFFSCMKPDGSLYTDVFRSEDPWDPDSRQQKCLSAKADGLKELTWLIGKPTKFLAKLYLATGDTRYLRGADRAFRFFLALHPNAWKNYASCKTMWAGTELYRITGRRLYLDAALRLADYYAATQKRSGAWVHTLWYRTEADQQFTWTSDITHEYGAELSDVIYDLGCIGARRRPPRAAP